MAGGSSGERAQSPVRQHDLVRLLDELEAVVERLTAVDPRDLDGALAMEASPRLRAAADRLGAQRLGLIGEIDADGLWASEPVRTLPHWLVAHERVSAGSARKDVRTARVLRDHLAATAEASRAGIITPEHVGIVVGIAATSEARLDALTAPVAAEPESGADVDPTGAERPVRGEDVLLSLAGEHSLRDFTRIARRFAVVADPESDERGYRLASEREHLDLSPTLGGYHVQGFLTEEHGQLVRTALGAVMAAPERGSLQSPAKRRAVALAGLARHALDGGRLVRDGADTRGTHEGPSVRPHLTVTVSWSELARLADGARPAAIDVRAMSAKGLHDLLESQPAAWSDGRGPVPPAVLTRIASDCALTRVVFGTDSQVIDVGRAQRTFTGPRRKAIIARDRHCVWPGCDEPPERAQIHHARLHWADGGATSTDNAALLCWHHHDHVDTRRIGMSFTAGRWRFGEPGSYGPDGGRTRDDPRSAVA